MVRTLSPFLLQKALDAGWDDLHVIRSILRRSYRGTLSFCRFFGFDPMTMALNMTRAPVFVRQLIEYQRLNTDSSMRAKIRNLYPLLGNYREAAGVPDWHYFHQDLWAARKIFDRRPANHIDIGSRIDGFVSHLLVFMPVSIVDIRPLDGETTGLRTIRDDATELHMFEANSIDSLSSLHAAEHFGLGRYGDSIDPTAWARFTHALQRVLAPNGRLYFSVPIGRQRVEFNAHRIFEVSTILRSFTGLELVSFAVVGEDGLLHEDVSPHKPIRMAYGCGLFEFTKML